MIWKDPKRECHCQIDEPEPGQESTFDNGDRTVMANIAEHGWHIVQILDEPQSSGWVFSVGMWHTLGSPELAVFGLPSNDAGHLINQIGDYIRSGRSIGPAVVFNDVLEDGRPVTFRPADSSWYGPMFGYATWFGGRHCPSPRWCGRTRMEGSCGTRGSTTGTATPSRPSGSRRASIRRVDGAAPWSKGPGRSRTRRAQPPSRRNASRSRVTQCCTWSTAPTVTGSSSMAKR